ncbi:3'-5' exonuclease [Desulfitobacterium sp. THU1]|uniref:3'-5' exonuclease n=1 Tax=Desulfitobacterium sp. THU1 TaxID=3138072 RepID=UPI00311FEB18
MAFIIFDLEFNQDISTLQNFDRERVRYPFEIIQIGAIKLDTELNTQGKFNHYIKPTFYARMNPLVSELTGITIEQLLAGEPFPEIYQAYTTFIDETDSILCTWGMSDITELFRNVEYHGLDQTRLPRRVIDLQFYVSEQFNRPRKNRLRLQHAVELLNIPITHPFHNALNDAYYTAEVFKKVYKASMQPKLYDPSQKTIRPRVAKRVIDFDQLLRQFEKMYTRKMTEEEQEMIKLAYKMGRTNQFTKEVTVSTP